MRMMALGKFCDSLRDMQGHLRSGWALLCTKSKEIRHKDAKR